MRVVYGAGFPLIQNKAHLIDRVRLLEDELRKMPQYEPITTHTFHAGMYCREVYRGADVLVVGKVHKKEHMYYIVSGTVAITTDEGVMAVTGPKMICSKPGTKRAVYSITPAHCLTLHRTDAINVRDAEKELVEDDPDSMYDAGNKLKQERLS